MHHRDPVLAREPLDRAHVRLADLAQDSWSVIRSPATRVASLLTKICVTRGWCLGSAGDDIVRNALDEGIEAVVDALICEELELPDPALLRQLDSTMAP
jgi:hypothetical protein